MEAAPATAIRGQRIRKTSKGRQKIEIKKVEKESNRYVTFSKRKNGIFKKATEVSTLCGAEVAVIIFSEHGKVFCCGNPDVDRVLDRYIAETEEGYCNSAVAESSSNTANTIIHTRQEEEYNTSLARLEEMEKAARTREKQDENAIGNEEFWWDCPVDKMEKEEIEGYKASLEELKKNVKARIEAMAANKAANESRIISQFINQNAGWSGDFY